MMIVTGGYRVNYIPSNHVATGYKLSCYTVTVDFTHLLV